MEVEQRSIRDVLLVKPRLFTDARGCFMEVWHAARYAAAGLGKGYVQDNESTSRAGTLRGLHYQVVRPQGKLVRVLRGQVYDVAVDLRRGSPTFGKWVGEVLSDENRMQLFIPPGFAHGFLALSDLAVVCYKCTDYYSPEYERTIAWNDPDIGVHWPLASGKEPVLSEKDRNGVPLRDAEVYR